MLGRIIISLKGLELEEIEKKYLANPNVGGVILFNRNYANKEQLKKLTSSIKNINNKLIITTDHEGGRVWRFNTNFTKIPAMAKLGELYIKNSLEAKKLAFTYGKTIAEELSEVGVDLSFTPVLDLNYNNSSIIGDRAFSSNPQNVIDLADSLIDGLHKAKSFSIGKHFPGHGFAMADSHLELPIDNRKISDMANDINIFKSLINKLDGIMTAHILYPEFDDKITTFSTKWLNFLRTNLGFSGAIISDDLSMAGAKIIPNVVDRISAAINAGCDFVIICNEEQAISEALMADYPKTDKINLLNQLNI